MSRYRPVNGMRRCEICGQPIPDNGRSLRWQRHFWKEHGFWGALLWRWDTGHRPMVIVFGVTLVVAGAMVVAAVRDAILH